MVIVKLKGGLGNQLFQYAAARRLSHVLQTTLKMDVSYFETQGLRDYSLQTFRIKEAFAGAKELAAVKGPSTRGLRRRIFHLRQKLGVGYHWTVIRERRVGPLNPRVMNASGDVYLDGFWQSEKYFKDIRHILVDEMTVKHPQDAYNCAMSDLMGRVESVSLHIRRGDYVSSAVQLQVHGVCTLDYYGASASRIAEITKQPHFFVFSDDIGWAQQNLNLDYPVTYVTDNGPERDYEDLRLMRQCKHHIIANSSFSWWGAWLGSHPDKIVIAPLKWFGKTDYDSSDLVPPFWMRI
jgi:hypothetical protein